ncbi:MAG: aminotransferase class V-fold PLP-dependent enzyme, partial [Thermoanaerobaculia bacterium]
MTMNRRALFSGMAAGFALPAFRADAFLRVARASRSAGPKPAAELAGDEAYWSEIARAFDTDRTLINLNNGGCSPTPSHVLEAMIRDLRFSNEIPVHHMWDVLEPRIESVRRELAAEFGCDPEEMAITRNTSEAMETLILGIDLAAGDEVVLTNQNYPRMITTWEQRARREGIVVKQISFPVPPPSMADVVERFRRELTPKTRVIEITHITNLTGQILPVRDIIRMARERGIEVFVDGAHAFAHFPFRRDELECD